MQFLAQNECFQVKPGLSITGMLPIILPKMAREIISSQEYQTSKFQKTDKLIEFSILDLGKNSPLLIDFESISLFFMG